MVLVRLTKRVSWEGRINSPGDVLSLSKSEAQHFVKKGLGVEIGPEPVILDDEMSVPDFVPSDEDVNAYLAMADSIIKSEPQAKEEIRVVHVGGGYYKVLRDGVMVEREGKRIFKGVETANEIADDERTKP